MAAGAALVNPRFGRYVRKASVAVDGISLTVASCSDDGVTFSLAVIPHVDIHPEQIVSEQGQS